MRQVSKIKHELELQKSGIFFLMFHSRLKATKLPIQQCFLLLIVPCFYTLGSSFGEKGGGKQERHFMNRHLLRPITPTAPPSSKPLFRPSAAISFMAESQKPAYAIQRCSGHFLINIKKKKKKITHLIPDFSFVWPKKKKKIFFFVVLVLNIRIPKLQILS